MREMGFWGIIHLALVVYAAIRILDSPAETVKKILWIAVVAAFPLLGLIIWFLLGPGTPKK